jgi:hypothetical protein
MTYTLSTTASESIDVDDYVDHIESSVNLLDRDSVMASADALRALSNNPAIMVRKLNEELRDLAGFQSGNPYSPQTFVLARGNHYLVRANVWMPPAPSAAVREWEDDLQAFELPHDHDFSFLTVGYLGSGYKTTIWEYDPDSVIGHDGERVELTYLETTTLERGKVMFYRASQDIHSQHHPAEFSVSVNLLIDNPEQRHRPQFIFDVENGTIASIAPTPAILGPQVVCELAGFVGDATTVNLLEDLAEYHERPRLRVAAYEALEALTPDRKAEFTRRALADRDEYVRHVSRARQVKLENP